VTQLPLATDCAPLDSIGMAFRVFHLANPHVYRRLVEMAREAKRNGHDKLGIGMLFEVVRWETEFQTTGIDFKLNNNFRSRYARLIMATEPDLATIFHTRELSSL
jgi:hypothetical protein